MVMYVKYIQYTAVYLDVSVFHFLISIVFFKQKTAYEMRISDWSSDVCSSDLLRGADDDRGVAVIRDGGAASRLPGVSSTLALARRALAEGTTLDALTRALGDAPRVDFAALEVQIGRAQGSEVL